MRAWPVARSIFDAPYVREANERTTGWIMVAARGAREGLWLDLEQVLPDVAWPAKVQRQNAPEG